MQAGYRSWALLRWAIVRMVTDTRVVVDLVEHAVVTAAESVLTGLGDERLYAMRPGIVGQAIDRGYLAQ